MKIEMDDNSAITAVSIIVAVTVIIICLGGCHITEKTNQEAIKAGLIQKPNQSSMMHWEKP